MSAELDRRLLPTIRRQDISWRTVGAFVEIEISLTNESDDPTEDGELVIEAAAFGAFVPFEPIARIAVDGFEPGERRTILERVSRDRLDEISEPELPEGARTEEWIGNLNVYFDACPEDAVEVHYASDLRVRAWSELKFFFSAGSDRASAEEHDFSFVVRAFTPGWPVKVESMGFGRAMVSVNTPRGVGLRARIEVTVRRKSDGKTVPVEFEMETVGGRSDLLGCVDV